MNLAQKQFRLKIRYHGQRLGDYFLVKRLSSSNSSSIVPAKVYSNADLDKERVIKENRGKSGIYRWTNLINNKSYIGSSTNLTNRFHDYFNSRRLREGTEKNMIISRALIKYGYSNFKLEILEYCEPENAIKREQFYIDSLKPEYNILQIAGSSLGYKHTESSLTKLRGLTFTEEHKDNLKKARASRVTTEETRAKMALARGGGIVIVTNVETLETVKYVSVSQAAKELGTNHVTLGRYIKSQKVFRSMYKISVKKVS